MKNDPTLEKLCVIGLGYVGLPTAAIFANHGLKVLGVDINPQSVAAINAGKIPIVETDLDILVNGAIAAGQFRAANAPEPADAFIIAVPTPFTIDQKPDLSYLDAAADTLAPVLDIDNVIIVESTLPVGSTERFSERLAKNRPDLDFPFPGGGKANISVAHCPERVLPGQVLLELTRNDRVVGGITPRCAERAAQLYQKVVKGRCFLTNVRTAELVKLAENAYRDVSIAFANELANVSDNLGINPWAVIELANHHPRVNILNPGPGVGGHCIAVDPWFIVSSAPDDTPLIQTARRVNDNRPARIAKTILETATNLNAPEVACLGLSYKADTDDMRESASIDVVKCLAKESLNITVVEPYINVLPTELAEFDNIRLGSLAQVLRGADIVVLLTDHQAFREIDITVFPKTVIDTRGIWNSKNRDIRLHQLRQ